MTLDPIRRPPLARIGVALLATAAASLVRIGMSLLVGNRLPFVPFFPAVMVSAWYGGLWAGVLCTTLSAALVVFFWLEPAWQFDIADVGDGVALVIFIGTGIAMAILQEALHRETARLLRARAETKEAAAANRAKDEFLSILSHELRTPLTAILGWTNVLRTRPTNAATQGRALETIERNAQAQARLIEDLLDVSRIVAGKLQLQLQPTDPIAVIRAALDVVRPAAEAKGVALQAMFGPDVGMIPADPDRLQQIMWNLLSNAVKFTPRGGQVEVRIERRQSHLRLSVADSGQGIPADFLPHVFERFRQADSSWKRAHGGLGLGLAIVKHMVDLHGGTTTAESEGAGKGATFTVSLPIGAIQSTEDPAAGATEAVQLDAGAACLEGVRVLVVDDDADARELIATILRDRGAQVVVVASAAEALRALERGQVDVLVSDIGMPGEDGYALMQRASGILAEGDRCVPALALTAYASPEDVKRAKQVGFWGHVAKPVVAEQLVQAVARLVLPP